MIRTFKAPTMADAMKLAKDFFGDDAIVLQSRKVKDPNLMDSDDDELVEITVTSEKQEAAQAQPAKRKTTYSLNDAVKRQPASQQPQSPVLTETAARAVSRAAVPAAKRPVADRDESRLIKRELKMLKSSVDSLREDIRRSHMNLLPETFKFLEEDKGFEPELASEMIQNIFLKLDGGSIKDDKKILSALHAEISQSLVVNNDLELVYDAPKIVCLVGPTGTGKTTSVIKLATHPKFYGKNKVGLITIDTYRVAAAAQLKTFAALARLPLEIAYEPEDFAAALQRLRDRDVILVDTAGRSPMNARHLDDLKQFFAIAKPDEVHLVLPISMRSDNLIDAVTNFSILPVNNLIVSKVDETRRLGNIVNVGKKIDLPISFLTNGQKVPDDIQLADKNLIADLILN